MSHSDHVRTRAGRARSTIAVVLVLPIAAIVGGILGYQGVAAPSSSAAPVVRTDGEERAVPDDDVRSGSPSPDLRHNPDAPDRPRPLGVTVDDGVVPDGVTVFDGEFPAVANLDADLLGALRRAAAAAAGDGVGFTVTSGWRSPAYQEQLLREAVTEYGSEEEAARWVATAETSAHVSGDAVDVGPSEARAWLAEHGARYGLCQTYRNEPWHYELRPRAVDDGCPRPYADPTHDPRMQQ
ncbi:M15 family metallopeptidase [Blastococcus sp. SYSU DS0552]